MKGLHHRIARLGLGLGLALTIALGAALPTLADTTTATATVSGGALSETTGATPSITATLDGTDQTKTYTLPLTATDPTGTGAGWNLTITSTAFSTGGATPRTLATGASTITTASSSCAQGTCTAPTNAITYPLTVPAGATAPTAVKFFNAAANSGMGQFTVTPTVSVSLPANTYAGTYTSTVTLAIVSAP
ncbi:MAG TPA: WxL domain-containing protein [Thermomicrobiales bacterium]|nr:WxL domain-containing protein [Thermomicrobiales bacterium]